MDERDLETEEPAMRLLVDQLDTLFGETAQLVLKIAHLVCDVMHAGTTLGQEFADRRFVAERGEQLNPALAHAHRGRLDSLLGYGLAALDFRAENAAVRVDGLVEVGDGNAEMVNPLRLHARRC
jgi:hypothetical protein